MPWLMAPHFLGAALVSFEVYLGMQAFRRPSALQVPFSAWWLGRYRYGPVEWLWRTLMYGVAQPMRQTA